jgi:hypothetical protein
LAPSALAQCNNFTVIQSTGTLVPGDTDAGNYGDDTVTSLTLPFAWSLYGAAYNSVNVSSNGNLQFTTSNGAYINNCLPDAGMGVMLAPHWDDLMTTEGGVWTSISGAAPNRIFNIEWRAGYYPSTSPTLHFEVRLYEGSARFDFVYGTVPNGGTSATVGAQDGTGTYTTQFECGVGGLGSGLVLQFDCPTSTPPSCSLAVNPPSPAVGGTFTAMATVTPGIGPPSTGITVSLNAAAVGGGVIAMHDDGVPPDAAAGDGVYSASVSIGQVLTEGSASVIATTHDAQGRSSTCLASVNIDAGDTIATAFPVDGSGPVASISGTMTGDNDCDMYRIHICDPANFSASTVGGTNIDTQLWLFSADGHGIAHDDDEGVLNGSYQSRLTNMFTASLPPGDYYLAITGYNQDCHDSGDLLLFNDTDGPCFGSVYRCEHGPDGPGGANPLDHWDTGTGYTGAYTIALTGVSGAACGPRCGSADFDCDGDTATDFDIEAFFRCLAGTCPPPPCTSTADFDGDGDSATDFDIEAFFRVLAGGHC